MSKKYDSLIKKESKKNYGIKLDVGCGSKKQKGFVGLDIRKLSGVDIVHDAEITPYPLPNECCNQILLSHLMEHMCPKKTISVMNELWRIMKVNGQLIISLPYAGSKGFWQDPTHCHSWNEGTVIYFDPHPPKHLLNETPNSFFAVYNPKPWKIEINTWYSTGNLECILSKRKLDEI